MTGGTNLGTPQAWRELGAACLGLYCCICPATSLYDCACCAAGDRAATLLRRYAEPGDALTLTGPVPADDLDLFWHAGQDCARLIAARTERGMMACAVSPAMPPR